MKGTLLLIELAGHVGLLLWGTHMVGTGVQRGFGTALRRWLGHHLSSRWQAFLAGLGVTTLLQSSTATGLLATSFTAAGVIDLAPALTVMLGANVGTALLTQALSFNVALVGPPMVLAGVLLFRWAESGRTRNLGRVAIGLGLMLMALTGLVHTLGPVESAPLLRPVLSSLADDPVLAAVIAAALTWACHSSIAIVLLVASFAATHVVSANGALAFALGANLGGALPALIAASSNAARRLPLGNLLVRATGVLAALPLLPTLTERLARIDPAPGRLVVNFHLTFNLVLAVVFFGLTNGLARLLQQWLPNPPAPVDPGRPIHLDDAALGSATVALANAARETLRMADMVETLLTEAIQVVRRDDRALATAVAQWSRCIEQLGGAIRRYLADIGDEQTLDDQFEGARGQDILSAVINLEHISDIVQNSLVEFAVRSAKRGETLSAEELEKITAMQAALHESQHLALAIFLHGDPRDAESLVARKAIFREFEASATTLSVRLLRNAAAASRLGDTNAAERMAQDTGLFLRIVRDLRRIHSHLASLAYPVLQRRRSTTAHPDPSDTSELGVANTSAGLLP